ncbi:MAG: hypothetical protein SGPRY_010444 [Prymnesium sp.]
MQGLPRGPPRLSAKGVDPLTGMSWSPSLTQFESLTSLARFQRHHPRLALKPPSEFNDSFSAPSLLPRNPYGRTTRWDMRIAESVRVFEETKVRQASNTRLRRAFLKEDPGIIGTVPVFLLRSCLRSGGVSLPSDEVLTLSQQYRGSDGRFAWLNFCDALESTPVCEMVRPRVRSRLPPGYPRKVAESTSDLIDPTSGRPGTYTVTELFNLKKKQRRGEHKEVARPATAGTISPRSSSTRPSTAASVLSAASTQKDSESEERSSEETEQQELADKAASDRVLVMARESLNARFTRMYEAFKHMDIDASGLLTVDELQRMLILYNIPISPEQLERLLASCDCDADGKVSYTEFVDAFARDTVQLEYSRTNVKKHGWPAPIAAKRISRAQEFSELQTGQVKELAEDAMHRRFGDMFKAFQYLDIDGSGKLTKTEILRGLELWNVPVGPGQIEELFAMCSAPDSDAMISFKEFKAALTHVFHKG